MTNINIDDMMKDFNQINDVIKATKGDETKLKELWDDLFKPNRIENIDLNKKDSNEFYKE